MSQPFPRFLNQLAHDLRSPLNVIGSTLTELAQPSSLIPADRERILDLSARAVKRLLSLSDRLALAARVEGPFEVTLQPTDLVQLCRETLEQFSVTQLRPRISVVTSFPPSPVRVLADGSLLTQLLLEVLTNANRFSRRQFRVEVSSGASAVVLVEDDGAGVEESERAVLFEPFALRRSRTGLGMGLWLGSRLAELHKGTLTVEHLSPGTRQRLILPLQP